MTKRSEDWYTPKYIFDALGWEFDLDVAAPVDRMHCHVPAKEFITERSLDTIWSGFIWMNAPYGNQADKFKWNRKFIEHGNGIALTPDRTSAPWWQEMAKKSEAVLFVPGKIKFIKPNWDLGESPANGTTLFSVGNYGLFALQNAERKGLGKLFRNY